MFLLFCGFFCISPAFSQTEKGILLVDDDFGSSWEIPWRNGLQSAGKLFDVLDTATTPATLEMLKKYKIVVWVTRGGRGDLSHAEMDILREYINGRGRVLVSGEYTGAALSWGWMDQNFFGFSYRNNTFSAVRVKPEDSFIRDFTVSTDYGMPRYEKVIFSFFSGDPWNHGNELTGMACGIENYGYGRKTVWLGFDLADVFSTWDQRRIVENSVYFLDWGLKTGIPEYRKTFSGTDADLEKRMEKREVSKRYILQEFKNILDSGTKDELDAALNLVEKEIAPELESIRKQIHTLIRFRKVHK